MSTLHINELFVRFWLSNLKPWIFIGKIQNVHQCFCDISLHENICMKGRLSYFCLGFYINNMKIDEKLSVQEVVQHFTFLLHKMGHNFLDTQTSYNNFLRIW